MPMKSDMTVLAGEITILRARVYNGSSDDDALSAKFTQLALANERCVSRMWDTERQLVLARRGEVEMDTSLKNMNRDTAQYVLKSEHESMLKKRDEWCISRQRAWGVPIPVFYEKASGKALLNAEIFNHVLGLVEQHGSDAW